MKYLVLGAEGQLGQDLCRLLGADARGLGRAGADITSPDEVRKVLQDSRPGVVLNCAAYNFVDRAEDDPRAAFEVNALGARNLALACREAGCTLVHFSSDYVFGLEEGRQAPYREGDAPGPVSVYGLSKLAGEYLVRSLCPRHFVIRTCGLYGARGRGGKGTNFVDTILKKAGEGKPLRVVDDQRCTPTYTPDLAAATVALLGTNRFGLFHLTNAGSCSWYEFARAALDAAGFGADLRPVTSLEYGARARRPGYSVLAGEAFQKLGLSPPRPWREALGAYLGERGRPTGPAPAGP